MQERETLDGKYAILRSTGQGSSAVVYEAENLLLGRRVAIKHFRRGAMPPDVTAAEFVQKLRDVARLEHPNITGLQDMGLNDGRPYIVTDHLQGNELDREIEGSGAAGISAAGDLILQVLSALDCASEFAIHHGALHPGNVLVVYPRPGVPWVKVTDFGVTQALWRSSSQQQGPKTASPYLPPEVHAGGASSFAADVYSAAALLYALLHGEPPDSINHGAETGGTRVPKPLAKAIREALQTDPAKRPTAAQFGQTVASATQMGLPLTRGLSVPPSIRWVDGNNATPGSLRIYGQAPSSTRDPIAMLESSAAGHAALTESLLRNPRFPKSRRKGVGRQLQGLTRKLKSNPHLTAAWAFALASLVAGLTFALLATWLR